MKISRSLLLLTLFVLGAATVSRAQVSDTYIVPAVAYTDGANGTRWATQLFLFNPQSYNLDVSLTFVPTGGTTGKEVLVTIRPNETVSADNVLDQWFNRSGTGSLVAAAFKEDNPGVPDSFLDRAFLITTNTFNNSSNGTFSQTISGTRVSLALLDYKSDGISGILNGITNTNSAIIGYRTNLGAVNLGRTSVTMLATVRDRNGVVIVKDLPFEIPPQGHMQDRLPYYVDHGSIELTVNDPSKQAAVYAYASVVDNKSGDGRYVEPVLLATPDTFPRKSGYVRPDVNDPSRIDRAMLRALRDAAERGGRIDTGRE